MEAITRYCTTDLDLYSAEDPTALVAAFEIRGFMLMRPVTQYSDGEWFCGFSTGGGNYDEPEPHLAAILAVIEALDPPSRSAWAGCSRRLFDIGYDCVREPFAFRQELSAEILVRLAAVGATLRITLYSDPETRPAEPDSVLSSGDS
jgi:hypothetical protein